jgi:hypothetical protein
MGKLIHLSLVNPRFKSERRDNQARLGVIRRFDSFGSGVLRLSGSDCSALSIQMPTLPVGHPPLPQVKELTVSRLSFATSLYSV